MSLEMAEKVVSYILSEEKGKDREVLIAFHGGEPFLNFPTVNYVVTEMKKRLGDRVAFAATTNGTVLDEEEITFSGKNIEGISVSLDGDRITHDAKRKDASGKGSHQKALATAKKLQEYNSQLRVRMTFDHKSVRKLCDNVVFLAEQGFHCLVANADFYDQGWGEEEVQILEDEMKKVKQRYEKDEILISLCEPMRLYCLGKCKGGITGQHIFPDGKLYPCIIAGGIPDFEIGDIKNGVDREKLGRILDHAGRKHEECKDCALATGCDGSRCMIINKVVMGDWCSPIPMQCQMNRLRYELNGVQ